MARTFASPVLAAALLAALAACGGGGGTDPGGTDVPADGPGDPGDGPGDPGPAELPDAAGPDGADPSADGTPADAPPDAADLPPDVPADLPPDVPPYPEPAARVLYDLLATPAEGFFPWDRHLAEDGGITVDGGEFANANLPLLADGPYPPWLAKVHGFATYAPLVFQTSVEVDPATLPADIAGSTAADASVRLYEVGPDGLPGARAAFTTQWMPYPDEGYFVVRLLPAWPLGGKRYLLAVTDALEALDGTPLARSRGFAQVMGQAPVPADAPPARSAAIRTEAERVAPLVAALPDGDRVVAAATFTTGWAWDDAEALKEVFGRFVPPAEPPAVTWDVDGNDDGTPDVVRDGQMDDCRMDGAALGWALKGTFRPWNLTGPDGDWQRDEQGRFREFPPQDVDFRLMVPAGAGPFPVVLAQHGIASDQHAMCRMARPLVQAGMAVLRFDFPRHGSRGKGTDDLQWGYDFLSVDNPVRIRENFRQAALDCASALVLLDGLAADGTLWREGDPRVDTGRVAFLGHSLGSIIGLLYLPFSARVQAFVSNVGGLGMFHLVELYVQRAFGDVFLAHGYLNAAEHAIWAGDGIAYADRLRTGFFRPQGSEVRLLAHEVIDDDTIANASTEILARAAGLPQVGPVHRPIPGVPVVDATTVESALMQFDGVVHGDMLHGSDADAPPNASLMMRQAVEYLRSHFAEGKARILTE